MNDDDLLGGDFAELRGQLTSLADEGAPKLTSAARSRILDRVEEQGPSLVLERAGPRWGLISLGLSAAAAAALIFWFVADPTGTLPTATGPAAACASWESALATPRDGRLDLGRRGQAEFAGDLTLEALDGCTTELDLRAGRVDVRADDLGGGTLRVVAGEISVEVWGTRFSVTREDEHVEVVVTEGHVVVRAASEREIHLHGGERWSRGERQAEVVDPRAEPVAVTVAAPIPESTAAEAPAVERTNSNRPSRQVSDRERLAQAERFWRESDRDAARRIFRRVGHGRGALAEAAWVRLARLELSGGEASNARAAAVTQRRRFPRSRLGAEALWIQADASRRLGDRQSVQRALRTLRERYPDSPQARAASNMEAGRTP